MPNSIVYKFQIQFLIPNPFKMLVMPWFPKEISRSNEPCRQIAVPLRGPAIVAAFAVCIQSCYHPIVSQLTSSGTSLVCAWLIASRKKKRRSRATPQCVVKTPSFPLSRSHILCTGPPCRESPSLRMSHITGFFNARLPGCRRSS